MNSFNLFDDISGSRKDLTIGFGLLLLSFLTYPELQSVVLAAQGAYTLFHVEGIFRSR
ncbi:MAG: hypothetical protein V7K41_13205 [Nostoc sp.]|uniref:hypothetical protein n=1 Tax=Nostoc sp. TaxID=1180 RepID=UPI002FF8C462